jgi:hypothetical protein
MQQKQYDKPMTFVNTKRVRTGDVTAKGAEKTVLTFGLTKDYKTGAEINTLDQLIDALLPYQGKQVNFSVFIQEKEKDGRTFPTAYVGITEMIPKDQQQSQTRFVPKASKGATAQANADKIRQQFSKG